MSKIIGRSFRGLLRIDKLLLDIELLSNVQSLFCPLCNVILHDKKVHYQDLLYFVNFVNEYLRTKILFLIYFVLEEELLFTVVHTLNQCF